MSARDQFLRLAPGVAAVLACLTFSLLGMVAFLERDWIKGAMVAFAVLVLVAYVVMLRRAFAKGYAAAAPAQEDKR